MAEVIYELATDISLENITVHRRYYNGTLSAYRLTANDGYVMYDTQEEIFETDENGNEVQVIYYCRQVAIPTSVPIKNWSYVAVLESDVNKDNIN